MMLSRSYGRKPGHYNTEEPNGSVCVCLCKRREHQSFPWNRKKSVSSVSLSSPLYTRLPIPLWSNHKTKEYVPIVYKPWSQQDSLVSSTVQCLNALVTASSGLNPWPVTAVSSHHLCKEITEWHHHMTLYLPLFVFGDMLELSWKGRKLRQPESVQV